MIGYVVPRSLYRAGYHCKPNSELPFANIANQKNFISFYHMGMYAQPRVLSWFTAEYQKVCSSKLDMGKCCIRLKKLDDIPFELIGKLMKKMTVHNWIDLYERSRRK